jgi:hypothetical protein
VAMSDFEAVHLEKQKKKSKKAIFYPADVHTVENVKHLHRAAEAPVKMGLPVRSICSFFFLFFFFFFSFFF